MNVYFRVPLVIQSVKYTNSFLLLIKHIVSHLLIFTDYQRKEMTSVIMLHVLTI
jgi:hypothetical protein